MVVNVCEGQVGADAHQPGQAVFVAEQRVVVLKRSLVHCCLKAKIPGSDMAISGIHKLSEHLPGGVGRVLSIIVIPELCHRQLPTWPRLLMRQSTAFRPMKGGEQEGH